MLTFRCPFRSGYPCVCRLRFTSAPFGAAHQTPTTQTKKSAVSAAPSTQAKQWTGDLDGMLKRRTIRVVLSYSKTQYYVLKGVQYGISYEGGRAFEKYINPEISAQDEKSPSCKWSFGLFSGTGSCSITPYAWNCRHRHHSWPDDYARAPEGRRFFWSRWHRVSTKSS